MKTISRSADQIAEGLGIYRDTQPFVFFSDQLSVRKIKESVFLEHQKAERGGLPKHRILSKCDRWILNALERSTLLHLLGNFFPVLEEAFNSQIRQGVIVKQRDDI